MKEKHTCFGDLTLSSVGLIEMWRQTVSSILESIEKEITKLKTMMPAPTESTRILLGFHQEADEAGRRGGEDDTFLRGDVQLRRVGGHGGLECSVYHFGGVPSSSQPRLCTMTQPGRGSFTDAAVGMNCLEFIPPYSPW